MTLVVQKANLVWKIASIMVGLKFVFMPFLEIVLKIGWGLFPKVLLNSHSSCSDLLWGWVILQKSPFAQANVHAKKSQMCEPSDHRAKNQHFWNPTNYRPLHSEFYTDHYSQKDCTLKSNFKKDMTRKRFLVPSFCSPSYVLLPFIGPTLKVLWLFYFSCRPVSFASISALCGIECNKSCVKQTNLVTSCKHCFLLVKLVTAAFFWKISITE